jgi:hypothetical protein
MTILGKNIKITSIILLFLSLTLTSCFDVIQDIEVKENGSGKFALTINLSKSKSQISKILTQESIQGFNIPSVNEIEQKLNNLNNQLNNLNGLSNIFISKDFENYIFILHFDFKHIDNINQAQIELAKFDSRIGQPIVYSYSENEFSCHYSTPLLKQASDQLIQYNLYGLNMADIITIYRFDNQISSCSSTTCQVSKNGQSTFNKVSASDFLKDQQHQSLTITFK